MNQTLAEQLEQDKQRFEDWRATPGTGTSRWPAAAHGRGLAGTPVSGGGDPLLLPELSRVAHLPATTHSAGGPAPGFPQGNGCDHGVLSPAVGNGPYERHPVRVYQSKAHRHPYALL